MSRLDQIIEKITNPPKVVQILHVSDKDLFLRTYLWSDGQNTFQKTLESPAIAFTHHVRRRHNNAHIQG